MPWDDGVAITPLPDLAQVRKQLDLVDDALGKGAQIVNRGGGDSCQTLLLPAVLHPVVPGMRIYDEEHPDNRDLISRIVRERRSSFLNTDFIL